RRIPEMEQLKQEVAAWCSERNDKNLSIDWQFTTADARIKLHSLYPKLEG
ncbi:IS630 family transposase, partial [Companilactobacillus huachuanensis]